MKETYFDRSHIVDLIKEGAEQIRQDSPRVKHIIGIERWGVFPAIYLQQIFQTWGWDTTLSTVHLSRYVGKDEQNHFKYSTFVDHDYHNYIPNEILVVDDLVDKGHTMQRFRELYSGSVYRTFTIFKKPRSEFDPTYVCEELDSNAWVVFWWDTD